ncbi:hypothetical protein H9645_03300 [Luteimonas sp. Sa2BVA3]|uniref:Tetratricopeptide repeat protein n=1 Tax=Luteimonas colneyensis TaxID=2762230 RepID=A0ABR8UG96_9GAMM|nr:hypothetical protein [Luteimonas colneyensis]MBD7987053.1 hypothetical protein [Luteimonas colneyensis]
MAAPRALPLSCLATLLALACIGCRQQPPMAIEAPVSPPEMALIGAVLLDGLGDYSFPVTSDHPEVQRWFDQGLALAYGFNHDAAERAFLKATELDPRCAMCWWGAALVLGPHVNAAMDPADSADAWTRLQRAVALAPSASAREQAFITALSARYAEQPLEDRRPLDEAYAAATRVMVAQRPEDPDAAVLHAEALMDLQPWDYYDAALRPTRCWPTSARSRPTTPTSRSVAATSRACTRWATSRTTTTSCGSPPAWKATVRSLPKPPGTPPSAPASPT